jgi:hypothetical protein
MPLGGYCEECQRWVWLTPYGECEAGHKARSVRDVQQLKARDEASVSLAEREAALTPQQRARFRFWWRHSLWVGWTFTGGFFNWVAFFYVSSRTRYKPWGLYGFLYLLPLLFTLAAWTSTPYGMAFLMLQLFVSAGSVLHALYLRPYYRAIMFGDAPRRHLPAPPQPPPLLDPAQRPALPRGDNGPESQALREAHQQVDGILETAGVIGDAAVREKVVNVCRTADQILAEIGEHPAKASQARSFLIYYLDASRRIVEGYADLVERRLRTPEIEATLKHAEASLDSVQQAFDRELANVLADTVFDLDTEIELLEKTVRMDDLYGQTGGSTT